MTAANIPALLAGLEQMRASTPAKPIDTTGIERNARVLTLDIETLPALAWIYQLKQTGYIAHSHVLAPGGLLGFGWKWLDESEGHWADYRDGYLNMVTRLRHLLASADYVVTQNGDRFDLPKCRGYIMRAGLDPYPQPHSIDVMKTTRSMGFESSSLDYTARMLGTPRKVDNGGAGNWLGCVLGDPAAWEAMSTYCIGDVVATEAIYLHLLPWLRNPPTQALQHDEVALRCPRCGDEGRERVKDARTVSRLYESWQCTNCRGIYRGAVIRGTYTTKGI